jgi:tetratricopeptide (TPR) repeat protein
MRKGGTPTRILTFMSLALGIACALLLALGSARYGGAEGLVLRVRAEIAAHRPHPSLVPTPLPTPTVSQVGNPSSTPTFTLPATATPSSTPDQSSLPQSSPTPALPTATPSPTPSPTATATPAHRPVAPTVELTGFSHAWQTWNNCGPATLAMHLSYFGCPLTQADVGDALRPNKEDKNVSPEELAAFARAQGLHALVRVNGDADRLRLLLSNGLPVLIETWLEPEPGNGMGHYRLLTGYDEAQQEWIAHDAYVSTGVDPDQPYRGIRLSYDEVARLWAVFNRTYLLIYTDDLAPAVRSILGEDADEATMWRRALLTAQAETQQRPEDPFAWFNLGTDWVALGQFEEAAAAYDRARVIGLPWRMLWYQFGPFRAYYETGRYEEVIALANATLAATTDIEELHYWKGRALQAAGDPAGARQAFQRALALNPNYAAASAALTALGE